MRGMYYVDNTSNNKTENGVLTGTFVKPVIWLNHQILLRVDPMEKAYEVFVNDKKVTECHDNTVFHEFNVTSFTKTDLNTFEIRYLNDAMENILYVNQIKGMGRAQIICQPTIRIRDVIANTTINDNCNGVAQIKVAVKCNSLNTKRATIHYTLRDGETVLTKGYQNVEIDMLREDTIGFSCIVPIEKLWHIDSPEMVTLEIDNKINNRTAEFFSIPLGICSKSITNATLRVNGRIITPKIKFYTNESIADLKKDGYNVLIVKQNQGVEDILSECDKQGVLVIMHAGIDLSGRGKEFPKRNNPTNHPVWVNSYIERNMSNLHSSKLHCCVIGYIMGSGDTTGYSVQETYVSLKNIYPNLPFSYLSPIVDWANDRFR